MPGYDVSSIPVRAAGVWLMLIALLCTCGCEPDRNRGRNPASAIQPTETSSVWPFWPVRMRVHPLTRLTTDHNGQMVIEARVEFFDVHGIETRAVGQLVLEVLDATQPTQTAEAAQVWNQDLRDLKVNQRQYDQVVRTYLFRLEVDAFKFPQQAVLHAYFVSTNGQTMDDAMPLQR